MEAFLRCFGGVTANLICTSTNPVNSHHGCQLEHSEPNYHSTTSSSWRWKRLHVLAFAHPNQPNLMILPAQWLSLIPPDGHPLDVIARDNEFTSPVQTPPTPPPRPAFAFFTVTSIASFTISLSPSLSPSLPPSHPLSETVEKAGHTWWALSHL